MFYEVEKLEKDFDVQIITQNVDDLHERAGSRRLLHMHGELLSARCTKSHQKFTVLDPFDQNYRCRCCAPAQKVRPDIVWFGEMPFEMERIVATLERCDIFVSIGTSGNVYPAAGFVEIANDSGAETIELNLEPGACSGDVDQLEQAFGRLHHWPEKNLYFGGVHCVGLHDDGFHAIGDTRRDGRGKVVFAG